MLTAEIKINGNLIIHIAAHNQGYMTEPSGIDNACWYRCRISNVNPDAENKPTDFTVIHDRTKGALELVKKIIEEFELRPGIEITTEEAGNDGA